MTVTGALSDPIMMSPSGPASAKSAGEGVSSARAGPEKNEARPPLRPVKASANGADHVAVQVTNRRRVNGKAGSRSANANDLQQQCGISAPRGQGRPIAAATASQASQLMPVGAA